MKVLICLAALLLLLPYPSYAADTAPLLELQQLELVPELDPENTDLHTGLTGLWNSARELLKAEWQGTLALGCRLAAVCMLISLVTVFAKSGGLALPERAAEGAGVAAIAVLALESGGSVLAQCVSAVEDLVMYGDILFPIYAGAVAVAGRPVTAAAQAGATMLLANLIMRFASGLFIPAVRGYILLHAGALLSENGTLRQAALFLRSGAILAIRVLLIGFTGYLSLSGIIAGGADATAVKTARLALSGTVPVVGAIVADASDALLSGAGVLKNSIGLFGCFAACAVCLAPFIRALLHFTLFRLLRILTASFTGSRCGAMLAAVSDGYGFALGLLGTCCALQFLAFVVGTVVAA